MIPNTPLRVLLISGLVLFGAGAAYATLRLLPSLFQLDLLLLLAFAGAISTLLFAVEVGIDVVAKKKITNYVLMLSTIAGLVAVIFIVFTVIGIIQDSLGVRCSGIMGASINCATQPAFTAMLFIIVAPYFLILIGTLAVAGIISQKSQKQKIKRSSKSS